MRLCHCFKSLILWRIRSSQMQDWIKNRTCVWDIFTPSYGRLQRFQPPTITIRFVPLRLRQHFHTAGVRFLSADPLNVLLLFFPFVSLIWSLANSHPPARSPLIHVSYKPGSMKANTIWIKCCLPSSTYVVSQAISQTCVILIARRENLSNLSTIGWPLFCCSTLLVTSVNVQTVIMMTICKSSYFLIIAKSVHVYYATKFKKVFNTWVLAPFTST